MSFQALSGQQRATTHGRPRFAAACVAAAALSACSHSATTKIESASQGAQESAAFAREPARSDEQFELAMRYESGDGVEGDDAWAEYWAFRAALQGHEPAREWLRRQAYAEPVDQGVIQVNVLSRFKNRSHPSAQLWLAMAGPGPNVTPDTQREARSLVGHGLPVVRDKALRGDPWAKYLVGVVDDFALGDSVEALRWYTEAAQLGNVLAEDSLGHVYEEGRGAPADTAQAARWFQAAADHGYAPSQAMLGFLYEKGRGVTENPAEALRWYLKAAEQGMPSAQNRVASLYAAGRGAGRDEGEALRWFRAAARGGHAGAAENIRLLEGRKSSPDGNADASPGALVRAAVTGNVEAQFRLAKMYERGEGLLENGAEAARWYKRASEQNHSEAQVRLAVLYHEGRGVERDDGAAAELLRKAAAQENHRAEYWLGKLYESGLGVSKDSSQALAWYERAARGGDVEAKARISQMECERSATTRAFEVLLRCADRTSLQSALRTAGLRVVREDASGGSDEYEGTALLDVPHAVKVSYSNQGQFVALVHELPPAIDAKTLKRVISELTSTYGPSSAQAAAPGETRLKWTSRDGLQVEVVRTKSGADSYVAFRADPSRGR